MSESVTARLVRNITAARDIVSRADAARFPNERDAVGHDAVEFIRLLIGDEPAGPVKKTGKLMPKTKHCYLCSNSRGGPKRAVVTCHFRLGAPGARPVSMPGWAWDAISEANTDVHESTAQECDAYDRNERYAEAHLPALAAAEGGNNEK